jgi:hypothetical protein
MFRLRPYRDQGAVIGIKYRRVSRILIEMSELYKTQIRKISYTR